MIILRQASKIYKDSRVCALNQVDLSIPAGDYVSITGASGSGKSTLMHILGLLDTLTEGCYLLGREDVSHLPPQALARLRGEKIGFVFQRFHLIPGMTALENAALPLTLQGVPKEERLERASRVLAAVGLSHRTAHKPDQLSGGQQQRVAIARAIVTHPSIILADEPTAGLDDAASNDVLSLFDELHEQGNTIVLITHDHSAAARAARRIYLENGVLLDENPY